MNAQHIEDDKQDDENHDDWTIVIMVGGHGVRVRPNVAQQLKAAVLIDERLVGGSGWIMFPDWVDSEIFIRRDMIFGFMESTKVQRDREHALVKKEHKAHKPKPWEDDDA